MNGLVQAVFDRAEDNDLVGTREARAVVAELIAAAADVLRVERSQGVTDEDAEAAIGRLDAALARIGGAK